MGETLRLDRNTWRKLPDTDVEVLVDGGTGVTIEVTAVREDGGRRASQVLLELDSGELVVLRIPRTDTEAAG